ncbi:hypothetical protein PUV47_16670 [Pseudovibrio exalbescens]|uniref:LpxL/LpxP family acyltransferase n=1 Tax=Pseudovibrio exalbescens TaxID=197461 RepID=UPI0023666C90|nr:hypothetical protein [Pseudovibrio exalbescens]MDD7911566.1 hypothetical protein [Pseudovibrio exalbescens]
MDRNAGSEAIDRRAQNQKLREAKEAAQKAEADGDLNRALALWSGLVESAPHFLPAVVGVIRTQRALGQWSEALVAARKALATWPDRPALLRHAAQLSKQAGAHSDALQFARALAELEPENPVPLRLELMSLFSLGNYEELEGKIESALQKHPSDTALRHVYILLKRVTSPSSGDITRRAQWFHESPADRVFYSFYLDGLHGTGRLEQARAAQELHEHARQKTEKLQDLEAFRARLNAPPEPKKQDAVFFKRIRQFLCPPGVPDDEFMRGMVWGAAANRLSMQCFMDLPAEAEHMEGLFVPPDLGAVRVALNKGKGCLLVASHNGPTAAASWYLERQFERFRRIGNRGNLMLARRPENAWEPEAHKSILIGAKPRAELRAVIKALKENDVLALACDGSQVGSAVEVAFLDGTLRLWDMPARLAVKHGVPTFWCQPYWQGESIALEIEEIAPNTASPDADVAVMEWARSFASKLERHLRRSPRNYTYTRDFWARAMGSSPGSD